MGTEEHALPPPFDGMSPSDLRVVPAESSTDDDGERLVAVYSFSLDALTWVGPAEEQALLTAGVAVMESLPE
jgi:hypothetical protein